jgi:hypothetical protein
MLAWFSEDERNDLWKLRRTQMSEQQLEAAITPMIESERDRPPLALAIVAGTSAIAELFSGGSMSRRRVFASREDALAWLRERQRVG